MSYDRRTRDRYREVVTGVTGVASIGALTLTGGLMGLASGGETGAQQETVPAQRAQPPAAQKQRQPRREVLRERPYVTRVTVRYVTGTSAAPGAGGTVIASQPSQSSDQSGQSSGSQPQPAPQPEAPPPPPPPPAPEPAPSSGS